MTLADLKDDLVYALRGANCVEIFIGIDAVSLSQQRLYRKRMFNGWPSLERKLRACLDAGITPTCAFLIEDPWRTSECVQQTLLVALQCRLLGCGVRLNSLSLYNNTVAELGTTGSPTYSDLKVRVLFDSPWMLHSNHYAKEHPLLYPLHSTYMQIDRWTVYMFTLHTLFTLFQTFPMTLMAWFLERSESLFSLAEAISSSVSMDCDPLLRRSLERDAFVSFCSNEIRGGLPAECFLLERAIADAYVGGGPRQVDLNHMVHDIREALVHEMRPAPNPTKLTITLSGTGLQIVETANHPTTSEVHCAITAAS